MKLKFENSTGKDLQFCIEPFLNYIDWGKGRFIDVELRQTNDKYDDELNLALTDNILILYECRQYETKIFVDGKLMYSTP